MSKLKVFISSVQDELINERVAIVEMVSSDAFLSRYVEPILFEKGPARSLPVQTAYLKDLESSDVYLGILGYQYGKAEPNGLSAPHTEYQRARKLARERGMHILFFVRGNAGHDSKRDPQIQDWFKEIRDKKKGHTYRRFESYQDLKAEVRKALLPILEAKGFTPTEMDQAEFENTIEAASDFDTQIINQAEYRDLDHKLIVQFCQAIDPSSINAQKPLINRGLLFRDDRVNVYRPSATCLLMFGRHPDAVFPQCRIVANAYTGTDKSDVMDRDDIREPMPRAIERAIRFLIKNTRHITTVRGFARVAVDEYPHEVLREALVNAVAHRDYSLRGSSIRIEKYVDRLVIMSPGAPPKPVTMAKIRNLTYTPCSRNPVLARTLSFFERIEEQGDGIRRMVEESRNVGLREPEFALREGYFTVTFTGPGKSLAGLHPRMPRVLVEVPSGKAERMSNTQKRIIRRLLRSDMVTVPELTDELAITPQAVRKALIVLIRLGLVVQQGHARATFYKIVERETTS